jgi:3-oxoacyl-[acyl-carrier protein] reductase
MLDFSGKVAIVTGASRGIGRAIATMLASRGAHVVAAARGDNAAGTVEAIAQAGGRAERASVDVTDAAAVAAFVSAVLERHGRIDILVNNAGIARDQLMLRMKRDDWDQVIATNLTSAFTCVQAVLNAGQANYAASKAGLIGFSKALAREVASRNITVNVVAPGLVETDMTREITDRAQGEWASQIPLGRIGSPADVAAAVCFLASDEASYITGHVLAVNGGMYM